MYHRFEENKYPSTNISMDVFKKHVELIFDANLSFYHPKKFEDEFDLPKKEKITNFQNIQLIMLK